MVFTPLMITKAIQNGHDKLLRQIGRVVEFDPNFKWGPYNGVDLDQ